MLHTFQNFDFDIFVLLANLVSKFTLISIGQLYQTYTFTTKKNDQTIALITSSLTLAGEY